MVNQVVNKVFLSHKAICSAQAVELARALDEVTPGAGIFRSVRTGNPKCLNASLGKRPGLVAPKEAER